VDLPEVRGLEECEWPRITDVGKAGAEAFRRFVILVQQDEMGLGNDKPFEWLRMLQPDGRIHALSVFLSQ
jgi:hypothetical protein